MSKKGYAKQMPMAVLLRRHQCPCWARSASRQCRNVCQPGFAVCRVHGAANAVSIKAAAERVLFGRS